MLTFMTVYQRHDSLQPVIFYSIHEFDRKQPVFFYKGWVKANLSQSNWSIQSLIILIQTNFISLCIVSLILTLRCLTKFKLFNSLKYFNHRTLKFVAVSPVFQSGIRSYVLYMRCTIRGVTVYYGNYAGMSVKYEFIIFINSRHAKRLTRANFGAEKELKSLSIHDKNKRLVVKFEHLSRSN